MPDLQTLVAQVQRLEWQYMLLVAANVCPGYSITVFPIAAFQSGSKLSAEMVRGVVIHVNKLLLP